MSTVPTATADDGSPPQGAWRDPRLPLAERVEDLLGRLTRAERVAMLHQYAPAVPRLGLAAFRTGTEALHGVAWLGEATVFPQAVGLGASWDPELLERVGEVVSTEVRAKHAADPSVSLNVWAPVVNLLRDPRWGRNEEGYSEDPLLTARLATAYCRGLRGPHPDRVRTAPTLKHFLAYNNETDRDLTSSGLRPRVLHEYDLPPFVEPVAAGVVDAVMPGYNLVNGRPNHVGPLLDDELRARAPHELLVVSDAEAPSNLVDRERYADDHAAGHAAALRAGVDSFTDHGDDPSVTVARITQALARGLLTDEDVDRAVRRVLTVRFRTGEFDGAADPYAAIGPDALLRPGHRELAREAARAQVVLLCNEPPGNEPPGSGRLGGHSPLLPLPASGGRIAVLGPLADTLRADWYSGTLPYRVSVAAGLRAALAGPGGTVAVGTVTVAEGLDRVALRSRTTGRFVAVPGTDGDGDGGAPVLACREGVTADDEAAWFDVGDWGEDVVTLRSAATGRYVTVPDDAPVLVADQEQPHGWSVHETFALVPLDGAVALRHLHSGTHVRVDPATGALTAGAGAQDAERFDQVLVRDGVRHALDTAAGADTVVLVVGNDPHINGRETQDRTTLALPRSTEELVRAVAGAHPRTVLVVMSSYPYAITWAREYVPAIVWTSHAGQETGHALADVLLGRYAPSGRLPQTWYRDEADLPDLLEYDVVKARRTYQYFIGRPLFPFGHGLTYTTFAYGPARVALGDDTLTVSVEVTNTGDRPAAEVVQVYTRLASPGPDRPRRRLQAFVRVPLRPGATRRVTLTVPVARLACWDVAEHAPRVEPGRYEVLVGRSCEAIEARAVVDVPGRARTSRPVAGIDLAAVDFDDHLGVRLVDTTRERGDAVEVGDDGGWLLFRAAELGRGPGRMRARVSRTAPGTARLRLRADDPVTGPPLGGADVPSTGGRYAWVDVEGAVDGPGGVRDLYVVLTGAQRVDRLRIDRPGPVDRPGPIDPIDPVDRPAGSR